MRNSRERAVVIHRFLKNRAKSGHDGHSGRMPEDISLTPTDVAEALGCPITEVVSLIESGRLPASKNRGWRIAHDDLAAFICESRTEALELGHVMSLAPSFSVSRPLE